MWLGVRGGLVVIVVRIWEELAVGGITVRLGSFVAVVEERGRFVGEN